MSFKLRVTYAHSQVSRIIELKECKYSELRAKILQTIHKKYAKEDEYKMITKTKEEGLHIEDDESLKIEFDDLDEGERDERGNLILNVTVEFEQLRKKGAKTKNNFSPFSFFSVPFSPITYVDTSFMFGFGIGRAVDNKQWRGGSGEDTEESKSNDPSSLTDEHISSDDYFIVRNALVLLICCSEYEGGWDNLEGVKTDHKILHKLFHEFYGWTVESISQSVTAKAIGDFFDLNKAKITMHKNPRQFFLRSLAPFLPLTCTLFST